MCEFFLVDVDPDDALGRIDSTDDSGKNPSDSRGFMESFDRNFPRFELGI